MENWDVVIVGGGASGMSAALILAQARRTVLVLDGGSPRNRFDDHQHGYLTRDGMDPAELIAIGRGEAEQYGAVVRRAEVTGVTGESGAFHLSLKDSASIASQRLLIATGIRDELPDVEGIEKLWGDAVFHCPYCHGCEIGEKVVGVLAVGEESIAEAHLLLQWANHVVLLLNDACEPSSGHLKALDKRGIRCVAGKVVACEIEGDELASVRLADGSHVVLDQLLIAPETTPNRDLLDELGVTVLEKPDKDGMWVPTDDSGLTDVPGVWVAGNVRDGNAQVIDAAAQGLKSAIAINADLTADLVKRLES